MKRPFDIVFEDQLLIVVNKAPGVLVVPGRNNDVSPVLTHLLTRHTPVVLPVHRIDQWTSGLVVLAKDIDTQRLLSEHWATQVEKRYEAICLGAPKDEQGIIDDPILVNSGSGKVKIHATGKASKTVYKVISRFRGFSHIKFELQTGRTHQIRVHCSHHGFPIAGDGLYGPGTSLDISDIKPGLKPSGRALLNRPALHASELVIGMEGFEIHRKFNCAPPKDMKAVLNQLTKWRTTR